MRIVLLCRVLPLTGLLAAAGCAADKGPSGSPVEQVWEAPPPTVQEPPRGVAGSGEPAAVGPTDGGRSVAGESMSPPAVSTPIAIVNGRPISRSDFTDMLVASHGVGILEQLVLLSAARQRAADMGLKVTAAEEAAAHEEALRRIATPIGNPEAESLDRATAERLLAEFLQVKNLSQVEWDCRMKQRACLRKISEVEVGRMEVTEQMLRDEYSLTYGERVQIRHIQVSSPDVARRARLMLSEGRDFEAVARELSENSITAKEGGLMPPFSRHDGAVPPLIREKAFTMQPGEVSDPVRDETWFHILRVDRKFPASSVGFEHIDQPALREQLVRRLVAQREQVLETELMQSAKVDIQDPELARQFRVRRLQAPAQ